MCIIQGRITGTRSMRRHPFQDSHPQFSVLESNNCCEYRVENWRLSRNGCHRVIQGTSGFACRDAALLALNLLVWWKVRTFLTLIGTAVLSLAYLGFKANQVLHESVVIIPPHGIQLETHRGFPGLCLFITRRFIRHQVLQDVIVHEGLIGWDVRYYLTAVKHAGLGTFALEVTYQNLLPPSNVLLHVYHDIHDQLLRSPCC